MSVNTDASNNISEAKEHIQAATEALAAIVIYGCYGSDDYEEEYRERLRTVLMVLSELRDKL